MKRVFGLIIVAIVIVASVLAYRSWVENKQPLTLPPVGDNLEASQLDAEQNLETRPTRAISLTSDSGSVDISFERQGDNTSYQLMAQLPPLGQGVYSAWLQNSSIGDLVNLGNLVAEKGGWSLSFQLKGKVIGYDTVIITKELSDDTKPEKELIRGELPADPAGQN